MRANSLLVAEVYQASAWRAAIGSVRLASADQDGQRRLERCRLAADIDQRVFAARIHADRSRISARMTAHASANRSSRSGTVGSRMP